MSKPERYDKVEWVISVITILAIPLLLPIVFALIAISDWKTRCQSEEQ